MRERFGNVILGHLGGLDFHPRPVSALTISCGAANLLSEKCSTESDISRIGRTARDPPMAPSMAPSMAAATGPVTAIGCGRQPVPEPPPRADGSPIQSHASIKSLKRIARGRRLLAA
jgi:hypothetical protein